MQHPCPDVMYDGEALALISRTIDWTERDRRAAGLPTLVDAPLSLEERCARLRALLSGDVSMDDLAAVGAQLVAAMRYVARAEAADPASGSEAA